MKNYSNDLNRSKSPLRPVSFMSLKDYLVGDTSPNPYASIDDFLDENWGVDLSVVREDDRLPNRPSHS